MRSACLPVVLACREVAAAAPTLPTRYDFYLDASVIDNVPLVTVKRRPGTVLTYTSEGIDQSESTGGPGKGSSFDCALLSLPGTIHTRTREGIDQPECSESHWLSVDSNSVGRDARVEDRPRCRSTVSREPPRCD